MNLSLLTLYVNDLPKSRAFYTDVIGFKVSQVFDGNVFILLHADNGAMLALEDVHILPPGQAKQPGSVEVGFEVEDVDVVYEQWKARGVSMVTEPETQGFGRSFLAKDPDGHYLSVYRLAQRQ